MPHYHQPMRKLILSILGVAVLIGSFYVASNLVKNKNRARPVPPKSVKTVLTQTVSNGDVDIVVPAHGNLVAKQRVELFSEVQGVFVNGAYLFKPGQKYRRGQTLIRIDASEYYASVQSAKSNLYNSITAIMPDLRLDFPEVYPKWTAYLASFDLAKSTPKLPEMTSEKENYFVTGRGIVSNYYNVKNLEQRLSKYTITAPFDGVLTEALVTEGSLVRNGQKLGEFINTSTYELEVAITKSYGDLLKVGEPVELFNLDGTRTYEGVVKRINGRVDIGTQTVTAFIELSHPDLKEGMYLEAKILAKTESEAIEIDRNLLTEDNTIYVVRDSVLDVMPVKPVFFSDTKVVLKGIPDGTPILARPVQGSYPGMLVKADTPISKTD